MVSFGLHRFFYTTSRYSTGAGLIAVFVGRFLPRSVTVSAPAGDGFPSSLASGLK